MRVRCRYTYTLLWLFDLFRFYSGSNRWKVPFILFNGFIYGVFSSPNVESQLREQQQWEKLKRHIWTHNWAAAAAAAHSVESQLVVAVIYYCKRSTWPTTFYHHTALGNDREIVITLLLCIFVYCSIFGWNFLIENAAIAIWWGKTTRKMNHNNQNWNEKRYS